MYYRSELKSSQTVNVENTMAYFSRKFKGQYTIEKAVLPGRDFVVIDTALKGIFISVKPNSTGATLKYNACPPSFLLRLILSPLLIIMESIWSKHIVNDIKSLVSDTHDMSQQ